MTGTFSISNCAWGAGVALLVGVVPAAFDPGDGAVVAAAASECCSAGLGLQAAREKLMTARTIATEYRDMFVFFEMETCRILTGVITVIGENKVNGLKMAKGNS